MFSFYRVHSWTRNDSNHHITLFPANWALYHDSADYHHHTCEICVQPLSSVVLQFWLPPAVLPLHCTFTSMKKPDPPCVVPAELTHRVICTGAFNRDLLWLITLVLNRVRSLCVTSTNNDWTSHRSRWRSKVVENWDLLVQEMFNSFPVHLLVWHVNIKLIEKKQWILINALVWHFSFLREINYYYSFPPQHSWRQPKWGKRSPRVFAKYFITTSVFVCICFYKKKDQKKYAASPSEGFGVSPPHRVPVELEQLLWGFLTDCYTLLQLHEEERAKQALKKSLNIKKVCGVRTERDLIIRPEGKCWQSSKHRYDEEHKNLEGLWNWIWQCCSVSVLKH